MKKIVKMSLVAAVAVAGLTTANAKPLTEAIKDVDVSGTVVYRYNDYNNDIQGGDSSTTNNYKIGLNVSSKVNDDLKVNTRFIVGGADNGFVTLDAQDGADGQANVTLSQVYFSYTGLKNTTVNVGKQGVPTPWTVAIDADGNEHTGTGALALSTWGPVTVAAAYFNQTNISLVNPGTDVYTAGVIGNVGPVVLDGWYLQAPDALGAKADASTFTLGAKANFKFDAAGFGVYARYTDLTVDGVNGAADSDNTNLEIGANVKVAIFDAKAVYAMTDKDGGLTAFDDDAVTAYNGWNIAINNKADADLYMIGVGVQAMEKLHIALNYTDLEYAGNSEEDEIYTQVTYNMSKNLSTYVRFGSYNKTIDNVDTIKGDYRGRLQVQYSF